MNNENSLAPIVLFTYNRLWHTQQTINALKKNLLAKDSSLIIYSDGAKSDEDIDKIKILRKYLHEIDGFKTVKIIERSKNLGLADSIITGVTEIVNKYGKVIVLEDDLVTSPYFLKYMNDALILYENEKQVYSVTGYIYNLKRKIPETSLYKFGESLGWGTWRKAWQKFNPNSAELLEEIIRNNLTHKFNFKGGYEFTSILIQQMTGEVNSWAIRWIATIFLNNGLLLVPCKALLEHIGNDFSGTHCDTTNIYDVELLDRPVNVKKIRIKENKRTYIAICKYFRDFNNSSTPKQTFFYKIKHKFTPPIILKLYSKLRRLIS